MITLEQVERLKEKANVSFEEAKTALEAADGDMLNALIYLERKGKVTPPEGGGYYSSQNQAGEEQPPKQDAKSQPKGESFGQMMGRFGRFCAKVLNKGNTNYLEAERMGHVVFSLPVTVVVLLLVFLFWVSVPLFIITLFLGFRYRFRGEDLGRESVNRVMDGASNAAEDLKRNFSESK